MPYACQIWSKNNELLQSYSKYKKPKIWHMSGDSSHIIFFLITCHMTYEVCCTKYTKGSFPKNPSFFPGKKCLVWDSNPQPPTHNNESVHWSIKRRFQKKNFCFSIPKRNAKSYVMINSTFFLKASASREVFKTTIA